MAFVHETTDSGPIAARPGNLDDVPITKTVTPAEMPDGGVAVYQVEQDGVVGAQANIARFSFHKTADKIVAYLSDVITYQMALKNTGNVPASHVVITDHIPTGTTLIPGSVAVSVPYTGIPGGVIQLTNPVLPDETVTISFKILVTVLPNPNPIVNIATAAFTYTVDPQIPDGVSGTATSNTFTTIVFRNNFGQQISDLIESVALEQAALAAIAQAEGAKIQKLSAAGDITVQELLCLNRSVSDMMDSMAMLEAVLKQKLGVVNCQINGTSC